MIEISRRHLLALATIAPVLPARATVPGVLDALAAPDTHAIMRHALAPGGGDPPGFRLDDPESQRRLSDAGRAQARETGAALRAAGVRFDRVLSSRWDRCLETARLLDLGPVTPEPSLDSFFGDRSRGPGQTAALRALLAAVPRGQRLMLVTHQVNITALTRVTPRSGEVVAFRIASDGAADVAGRGVLAEA